MGRKVIRIRIPKFPEKIIKSTNTRSVSKVKTTEDREKRIDLKLSSPIGNRMDFNKNAACRMESLEQVQT